MLKASKSVQTLEIQGARTYFVILFSGEMVNLIGMLKGCLTLIIVYIALNIRNLNKPRGVVQGLFTEKKCLHFSFLNVNEIILHKRLL